MENNIKYCYCRQRQNCQISSLSNSHRLTSICLLRSDHAVAVSWDTWQNEIRLRTYEVSSRSRRWRQKGQQMKPVTGFVFCGLNSGCKTLNVSIKMQVCAYTHIASNRNGPSENQPSISRPSFERVHGVVSHFCFGLMHGCTGSLLAHSRASPLRCQSI